MAWNYRVVRTAQGFSVFEVFYDESGRPMSCTERPTLDFFCETPEGVLEELEIIKAAFDQPSLDMDTIERSKGNDP